MGDGIGIRFGLGLGLGLGLVHIHDASGLCHKGSGFGMRRVGYGE